MNRLLASGAMLAIAACAATSMAEDLKSGLQLGESAGFFLVKDVTGPNKGKSVCYR